MNKSVISLFVLALLPLTDVLAKQDYTYVKSTLGFPWFIFFVIFILILIPFVMVIALSWKKPQTESESTDINMASAQTSDDNKVSIFNRIILPSLLTLVGVFSIFLVVNAYEAMDLMEHFGTAAPTMLNARP